MFSSSKVTNHLKMTLQEYANGNWFFQTKTVFVIQALETSQKPVNGRKS